MQGMIHVLHLKIVHHFVLVKQKLMTFFIDEANYIYIAMSMYSLIEYNDNYSD